jgi:hypothetical protein
MKGNEKGKKGSMQKVLKLGRSGSLLKSSQKFARSLPHRSI